MFFYMRFRNKLTKIKNQVFKKSKKIPDLVDYLATGFVVSGIVYLIVLRNAFKGDQCSRKKSD